MKAKKAHQESVNNQIYNVMLTNLLLTCYVLHEHFGFGAKRLDNYMQAIVEEAEHFDDMARDGVLDLKIADERRKYQQQFRGILQTTAKFFCQRIATTQYSSGVHRQDRRYRQKLKTKKGSLQCPYPRRQKCRQWHRLSGTF